MSKEMVISANPHETRVAILEEGQLCEYYVEREKEFALVGSIYKGRVTRVLPGMQSSFVDIGLDSDAFLYVTDFLEGIEELDEHVETAGEKTSAPTDQGGLPSSPAETVPPEIPADDTSFGAPEGGRHEPATPLEASPVNPPPALNTAQPDRPRYENRNRQGRDFGHAAAGAGDVLTAVDAAGAGAAAEGAMDASCRSRNTPPELTKIALATRVMRLKGTFP